MDHTSPDREITSSLLPSLVSDLWELGGSAGTILDIADTFKLRPDSKVIDLGCGKGAISVRIAERFKCSVYAVDSNPDFIEVARAKAEEFEASHLCQFACEDITDTISRRDRYDLAVYASMGSVLGGVTETLSSLRSVLVPGGHIILDHVCTPLNVRIDPGESGWGEIRSVRAVLRQVGSTGDLVEKMVILSRENVRKENKRYLDAIRTRSDELSRQQPHLKQMLDEFCAGEERECELMNTTLIKVIWGIQKCVKK